MFPWTRPYRQTVFTSAILLATVGPTLYVAWTAWRINQPGHLREVETEIGRHLGLHVTLDAVRYPKPGEVVYRGIILRQEEPRRKGLTEIARAKQVRLVHHEGELLLETDGLRLTGENPKLAMAQVGEFLQRPPSAKYPRISISARTCEIDLGHGGLRYELADVAGSFLGSSKAPSVRVSYRVKSAGANTRCELTLVRDRKSDPVDTTVTLKTMEGLPLPARVLDVFFDSATWLGEAARVEGTLSLRQSGGRDWEADFQGDLLDVDLSTLVERRFPSHHLSGLARIAFQSARWGDRPGQGFGWVDAKGELTAGQGAIAPSFLGALVSEMKFRHGKRGHTLRSGTAKGDLEFDAMGLAFEMTRDGEIHLNGCLGTEFAPTAVLADQTSALAFAPTGAANVRGLIKTLFPTEIGNSGVLVPLTAESRVLLSLPTPPNIATKTGATNAN